MASQNADILEAGKSLRDALGDEDWFYAVFCEDGVLEVLSLEDSCPPLPPEWEGFPVKVRRPSDPPDPDAPIRA